MSVSHRLGTRQINLLQGLRPVLLLSGCLVAVGLGITSSFAIALVIVVTVLSTDALHRFSTLGHEIGSVAQWLIAICFVIPLCALALVIAGGSRSTWGITVILVSGLLVALAAGRAFKAHRAFQDLTFRIEPFLLVTLMGLLTKMWFFLIPALVGLSLLFGLSHYQELPRSKLGQIALLGLRWVSFWAGVITSGVWASSPSGESLIFRSVDQYFRGSLALSTIRFGTSDNAGAVGTPLNYHWLSEAVVGLYSLLGGLPVMDAMIRLSALVASFAAVLGAYVLARVCGRTHREAIFSASLLNIFSNILYSQGINVLKTSETGQLWGTSLFLLAVSIFLVFLRTPRKQDFLPLVMAMILLTITNSTLGFVFFVGSVFLSLIAALNRRISLWTGLMLGVLMTVSMVTLRLTIFADDSNSYFEPQIRFDQPFDVAGMFGYVGDLEIVKAVCFSALLFAMWFQSGAAIPTFVWKNRGKTIWQEEFYVTVFALIGIIPAMVVSISKLEQYRFLLPILILGPIVASASVRSMIDVFQSWSWRVSGLFIGIVTSTALQLDTAFGKAFGGLSIMMPRLTWLALLIVTPCVFLVFIWAREGRKRAALATSGLFLATSLVSTSTFLLDSTRGQVTYARQLVAPSVANAGRYACLDHVRKTTPEETIVASNMWRFGEEDYTNKWFMVSAVSERRTYLDGPLYVQNPAPEWLLERMQVSQRFAIEPSIGDLSAMRAQGVDYFIVDRRWTERSRWDGFAEVVLKNSDCILLNIRS